MALHRGEEPFSILVRRVREIRDEAMATLCSGRWETEAEARGLVGQIKAMNDIMGEMRSISGPGTSFGETDL